MQNAFGDILDNLDELKEVDIKAVDINSLQDIRNIKINPKLSQADKLKEYVKQIKNPYCFRHGEYVVKVEYAEKGESLENLFADFVSTLE